MYISTTNGCPNKQENCSIQCEIIMQNNKTLIIEHKGPDFINMDALLTRKLSYKKFVATIFA